MSVRDFSVPCGTPMKSQSSSEILLGLAKPEGDLRALSRFFWIRSTILRSLSCSLRTGFSLGKSSVRFCICSELLWNFPIAETVLVVVHDGHYKLSYFSHLFELLARFRAQQLKCHVIYASWKKSFCL